jgi:hypothetical protein
MDEMIKKRERLVCLGAVCVMCAGCSRAPSVDILGTFFPAWMICLTAAVLLGGVVRYFVLKYQMEPEIGPVALFYPSVVILFSSLLWLMFFR